MKRIALWTFTAVIGTVPSACGQDSDPRELLQQKLNSQVAITTTTKDRSDIVTSGSVVTLRSNGLMMYSTASPLPPVNTYKNGKISQGGSGFGRDILITMAAPGNGTATDYPHRKFMSGEALWVTGLAVQKDGIVLRLYSDPYDGVRYYGQLKFPFGKSSVPTPEQALAAIAEALTLKSTDNPGQATASQSEQIERVTAHPVASLRLPSTYASSQVTADQLQLNADNSFLLQEGGQNYRGTFTATDNTLELNISDTNSKSTATIQGNKLTDNSGQTWVLREQSEQASQQPPVNPATPALPTPPLVPLKLPSTYVSAQTPADQLQLNADNSFSLKEAGQTYHGTFAGNGDALQLNIRETNTQTTATIHGNTLTDSSGQTWALREQSAPTVSNAGVLRNEDVIKLAKAGLGDAVIIAKIRRSNCQFDISVNALVELKKSGVSGTVLNAMVEAGK